MRALVLADRPGAALLPLTNRTCAALLPVLGKPILEHALEDLVTAGVSDIRIAVSPHADSVERLIGAGERWGVRIGYVPLRESDPSAAALDRVADDGGEWLVLRGDVLRAPCLAAFLRGAATVAGPCVGAVGAADVDLGIRLLRERSASTSGVPGDPEQTWIMPSASVTIREAMLSRLDSLAAFHGAALDAVAGRFAGLIPAGHEVAVGVTVGRRSRVPLRAVRAWPVFVGGNCQVDSDAELVGPVSLADDVVVDRRATLERTVVLPQSYVGELVELRDAIVWGDILIRVDSGAVLKVTDAFLLADMARPTAPGMADWSHRALGALALGASLPLWPVALAASLLSKGPLLERERLVGNRRVRDEVGHEEPVVFNGWQFATRVPVLRHLPLLVAVARGDLRLAGVSPLTPEESAQRTEEWQHVRDEAPVGLLGPAQLDLPGATLDERVLADAWHARHRSDMRWLRRGLAALVSSRGWRPPQRP